MENEKSTSSDSTVPINPTLNTDINNLIIDTNTAFRLISDSIYAIQIGPKHCHLLFTHQTFSPASDGELMTTVRIVNTENQKTIFDSTFNYNSVGRVEQIAKDGFIIDLTNIYGGSGFGGIIFYLKTATEISLQEVCPMNELTFWESNITGNKLLVLEGVWNMGSADGPNFEAHFSEHRQNIFIYELGQDKPIRSVIGLTKFKYDLSENGNTLKEMKKKETKLNGKISWEEFN